MKKQKAGGLLFILVVALTFIWNAASAYAVYSPEPQSGGRYFQGKGTKSSTEYQYLGRTGYRQRYPENYYGDGIQYKMLKLKPYAGYTGEWDTNVFLQDEDAKDDYISRLNWGVDAEVPMQEGKYVIGGAVHSESEWFAKYNDQNHTDWNYQGRAAANFNSFSIEVFEDFRRTVDRSGTELTSRVDRNENYLSGLLTVPFGEYFLETELSHYLLEFRDDAREAFDRNELRTIPRLGYNIGDRTQVLAEYGITHIDYDEFRDRNGLAHQWAGGVRGLLGEGDLINYQAWGGWEVRNYNSDAREDFSGFIFRADAEYRPSEFSRIFVEANRRPVESVSESNSFIVRNEVAAGWRRQLTERIGAELRGGVGIFNYSDGREDFFWEPGIRLNYLLPGKFAHLFTEYRYSARYSDVANADYNRNLWNFGIRAEL